MHQRLYFIESMGMHKIGIAHDVIARLRDHVCGNPAQITLVTVGPCVDLDEVGNAAWLAEKIWHERLKKFRRSGEWFALPARIAERVGIMIGHDQLPAARKSQHRRIRHAQIIA